MYLVLMQSILCLYKVFSRNTFRLASWFGVRYTGIYLGSTAHSTVGRCLALAFARDYNFPRHLHGQCVHCEDWFVSNVTFGDVCWPIYWLIDTQLWLLLSCIVFCKLCSNPRSFRSGVHMCRPANCSGAEGSERTSRALRWTTNTFSANKRKIKSSAEQRARQGEQIIWMSAEKE